MARDDLRTKPSNTRRIIAGIAVLLWAALIFTLSAIQGSGYPSHPGFLNYIAHFGEYMVFAVLLTLALDSQKRPLWKSALIAIAIASIYAVSDEFHQYFVPGRECDPIDWLTDTIGAIIGSAGAVFWLSYKRVERSRKRDERDD
jgi:VanZ family protein